MWCSGAHRGVTVITIVTIIFTPVWRHGDVHLKKTGKEKTETTVECRPHAPCPKRIRIVQAVIKPPVVVPAVHQPTQPKGKHGKNKHDR